MAINYDRFTQVQASMFVPNEDKALDGRIVVEEESQIDHILYPYLGMIVYAQKEDKYFKIKALKGGFALIDPVTLDQTGNPYVTLQELADANGLNISTMVEWVDYVTVANCFEDGYEEIPFDKIGDCNYIIVANEAARDMFANAKEGMLCYVADIEKMFMHKSGTWVEF